MPDILSNILLSAYRQSLQTLELARRTPQRAPAPAQLVEPIVPPIVPPIPSVGEAPPAEVLPPPEETPTVVPPLTEEEITATPKVEKVEEKLPEVPVPKPALEEPFYKKVFGKLAVPLHKMAEIDATSFGLIRGLWTSMNTGIPLNEILGIGKRTDAEGKLLGLWASARESTKEMGTAQRLIGELVLSPFNLLMFLPASWAGRTLARTMSHIARAQYRGSWWTRGLAKLPTPFTYSERGLAARVGHRMHDFGNVVLQAVEPGTNKTIASWEKMGQGAEQIAKRFWAIENYKTNPIARQLCDDLFLPKFRKKMLEFDEFSDMLKNSRIDWLDLMTPQATPKDIETAMNEIMALVTMSNAPIPKKMNFFINFQQKVKTEITPFLLSLTPRYFVYNTITDTTMFTLRHPLFGWHLITEAGYPAQLAKALDKGLLGGSPIGRICYEAFGSVAEAAGFTREVGITFARPWKPILRGKNLLEKMTNLAEDTGRAESIAVQVIPFGRRLTKWSMGANVARERAWRVTHFVESWNKSLLPAVRWGSKVFKADESLLSRAIKMTDMEYEAFVGRIGQRPVPKDLIALDEIKDPWARAAVEAELNKVTTATPEEILLAYNRGMKEYFGTHDAIRMQTMLHASHPKEVLRGQVEFLRKQIDDLTKTGFPEEAGDIRQIAMNMEEEASFLERLSQGKITEWVGVQEKAWLGATTKTPKAQQMLIDGREVLYSRYNLENNKALYKTMKERAQVLKAYPGNPEERSERLANMWTRYRGEHTKRVAKLKEEVESMFSSANKAREGLGIKGLRKLQLDDLDLGVKMDMKTAKDLATKAGLDPNLIDAGDIAILDDLLKPKGDKVVQQFNAATAHFLKNVAEKGNQPLAIGKMTVNELSTFRNSARGFAFREATRMGENDFYNYAMRTSFDSFLSGLAPYPFWATRFALHWGVRALENPAQFHALCLTMKHWMDVVEEQPPYLRFSPIVLKEFDDGTQLRFSPLTWFFPMGYDVVDVLKYGDRVNDYWDAITLVQNVVGAYYYPTTEMLLSFSQQQLGIPPYETRGTGMLPPADELLRDIIPQQALIKSGVGSFSPWAAQEMLEKGAFTEREINRVIYAIADAATSKEISLTDAEIAIQRLKQKRYDRTALRYLVQTLHRDMQRSPARYMGMPISYWYPEQRRTWEAQQQVFPTEEEAPPHPDVVKVMREQYPGLEVIRGQIAPAGLRKEQAEQWKATAQFYERLDKLQADLDAQLRKLQNSFERPEVGKVVTSIQYRNRRREIYTQYRAAVNEAQQTAIELNAPLTSLEREKFWKDVGREVYPRHPHEIARDQLYEVQPENFPDATGVGIDWMQYYRSRDERLGEFDPETRAWLKQQLQREDAPDTDYRRATEVLRKYWGLREMLLAREDPDVAYALKLLEYYERFPDVPEMVSMVKVLRNAPRIRMFLRLLDGMRGKMRTDDPEVEKYLQRYFR